MAGIEKICEYCNDYGGPAMYQWKHNRIQICPKCRIHFKGADATLYIVNDKYSDKYYDYCLHVKDATLQGSVNGFYFHHSSSISTVKRKLKRLLKCRKLTVKRFKSTCLYSEMQVLEERDIYDSVVATRCFKICCKNTDGIVEGHINVNVGDTVYYRKNNVTITSNGVLVVIKDTLKVATFIIRSVETNTCNMHYVRL